MPASFKPDLVDVISRLERRLRALEGGTAIVDFSGVGASALGFAVSTVSSDKVSFTVPVPKWAKRALVQVQCNVTAKNNSGADDFLFARCSIDGTPGGEAFTSVLDTRYGSVVASANRQILSLGDTIVVTGMARTSFWDWAANGSNIANIDGIAIFLRS